MRSNKPKASVLVARRTVAYIRVSSEEQAESGVSLAAQEERLRAYGRAIGREIDLVISDPGQSAKTLRRPGMKRLLEIINRREVEAVIILKLDRITRSIRDLIELTDLFEKRDTALISVSETLDTKTAAGRMVVNMLAVVGQWEREVIGERTAFALAHKRRRREVYGPVPFGWRRASNQLVAVRSEQAALKRAQVMRNNGSSLREIAKALARQGVSPRRSSRWHAQTVKDVLTSRIAMENP